MPRPTTAARRYAEAAFELAGRDDSHDRWDEDLHLAAAIVDDSRVSDVVSSPQIPFEQRAELIGALLEGRLSRRVYNLVRLLAQRRRLELLPLVATEFSRMLDGRKGVVAATVTSAVPLDDKDEAAILARLEEMTGRTVRLTGSVDPDLIGGVMVRVGDRLIDASVRGRLERLREQLIAGSR